MIVSACCGYGYAQCFAVCKFVIDGSGEVLHIAKHANATGVWGRQAKAGTPAGMPAPTNQGDGTMEAFEWMSIPLSGREHEMSRRELLIEVRIYEEDGTLYAEPVYYKVLSENDNVIMDGAHLTRHLEGRMWDFLRLTVEGEYTDDRLADIREWHPAFAYLRREDLEQKRMDNERYRASVL